MIFKGSEKRCIFDCDVCHSEFDTRAYNVLTGYWCPYCKKKTEAKVQQFLKTLNDDWKTQLRFEWCRFSKTGNVMPFDFGSISKKVLLEIDGAQHFSQVSNWGNPEDIQEKDTEKIISSMKEGYSIIHISQADIWNDVYDWKQIIQTELDHIAAEDGPLCIFVSRNPELYRNHCKQLSDLIQTRVIHP
jgi:very-short-patch-repair endonuclease